MRLAEAERQTVKDRGLLQTWYYFIQRIVYIVTLCDKENFLELLNTKLRAEQALGGNLWSNLVVRPPFCRNGRSRLAAKFVA